MMCMILFWGIFETMAACADLFRVTCRYTMPGEGMYAGFHMPQVCGLVCCTTHPLPLKPYVPGGYFAIAWAKTRSVLAALPIWSMAAAKRSLLLPAATYWSSKFLCGYSAADASGSAQPIVALIL